MTTTRRLILEKTVGYISIEVTAAIGKLMDLNCLKAGLDQPQAASQVSEVSYLSNDLIYVAVDVVLLAGSGPEGNRCHT